MNDHHLFHSIIKRHWDLRKPMMSEVLIVKAKEYAVPDDRLLNFRRAAKMDKTTLGDVCMGIAIKHFQSIRDMLDGFVPLSKAAIDEKICDALNYCPLLLACIVSDSSGSLDVKIAPTYFEFIFEEMIVKNFENWLSSDELSKLAFSIPTLSDEISLEWINLRTLVDAISRRANGNIPVAFGKALMQMMGLILVSDYILSSRLGVVLNA